MGPNDGQAQLTSFIWIQQKEVKIGLAKEEIKVKTTIVCLIPIVANVLFWNLILFLFNNEKLYFVGYIVRRQKHIVFQEFSEV